MTNVTGAAQIKAEGRGSADETDRVQKVFQRAEVYWLLQMRSDFDAVDFGQLARGFAQPIVLSADDDERAFETDLLEGR